jgi:hypothetical protein
MKGLRIAVVSSALAQGFQELGCEVLQLKLGPGVHSLQEILAEKKFTPDVFFQQESLGPRILFRDLPSVPCTKIFWSLDTHLNSYWHARYGRLFDLVLTTQSHWVEPLKHAGLPMVENLPWYGSRRPFVPWHKRKCDIGFIGRLSAERKLRTWMLDFIAEQHAVNLLTDVEMSQVPEVYSGIRIVPNEAIFREVNFRLFEGASAGCLILNPSVDADIGALFTPGKEVDVYENVLELGSLLGTRLANLGEAESIARAGWAAVQTRHLPVHRAERVLNFLPQIGKNAAQGRDADLQWWVMAARMYESNMQMAQVERMCSELWKHFDEPMAADALIRALHLSGKGDQLMQVLAASFHQELHAEDLPFNAVASAAAVSMDAWEYALGFRLRYVRSRGRQDRVPGNPSELLQQWADDFISAGRLSMPGCPFDERRNLPKGALCFLLTARLLTPEDLGLYKKLQQLLSKCPGYEFLKLGVLSTLSLHMPKQWRYDLESGLINLRAYRMLEGMQELTVGYRKALKQGSGDRFLHGLGNASLQQALSAAFMNTMDNKAPAAADS